MSVRAYRVIEIKTNPTPTFNLWFNPNLMEALQANTCMNEQLNDDGCGLICIREGEFKQVRKALKGCDDNTKEALDKMAEDFKIAKEKGDDFVEYVCY